MLWRLRDGGHDTHTYTRARAHTHTHTQTDTTEAMVIPHSYAMYGYAGYAKHGYVTWLYHCDHVGYAKNLVTPHGYAT